LFKKFHPRINLTTLFLTKTYLLNTIKLFQNTKTGPWGLNSKTSLRWLPLGTRISKFWVFRMLSSPKWGWEPKFQLSRSYGLGCRRVKKCPRQWRVTDGKYFIALWLFIGKKHVLSKINFKIFGVKPIYVPLYISYMRKVINNR
jgi:hypothetical protein